MLRPVWKQNPGAQGIKEIAKRICLSLWCVLRVAQPCLASMRQDIWNTCQCSADRMADCLTSWNKSFRWCDVITKFANAADGVLSKRVTWRERHSQDTTRGCGSTILSSRAQEGSQSPFLRLDSLCVRKKHLPLVSQNLNTGRSGSRDGRDRESLKSVSHDIMRWVTKEMRCYQKGCPLQCAEHEGLDSKCLKHIFLNILEPFLY